MIPEINIENENTVNTLKSFIKRFGLDFTLHSLAVALTVYAREYSDEHDEEESKRPISGGNNAYWETVNKAEKIKLFASALSRNAKINIEL